MTATGQVHGRRASRLAALGALMAVALGLTVAICPTAHAGTACPPALGLVNGGMQVPAITVWADVPAANAPSPTPGVGWSTDDPGQVLELWQDGFQGVPADSGSQFMEINANAQDTVTQDIATTPGTTFRWRLAHRGRAGTDTMQVRAGPPGGPLVAQVPDGQGSPDIADSNTAWGHYTGLYTVPAGQTTTRLAFAAVAEAFNPSYGNFLDSVSVQLLPTAANDVATTAAGHPVAVPVLVNDCGSGLVIHSVGAVSHGTAVPSGASILYTPPPGFTGSAAFSYTVLDLTGATATATVTVQVSAPAPPTATAQHTSGPSGAVQVARPLVPAGDHLRLLDHAGHPVSVLVLAGQGVYAVAGTTLTFTPVPTFTGPADVVRFQVSDPFGGTAVATYQATVLASQPPTVLPTDAPGSTLSASGAGSVPAGAGLGGLLAVLAGGVLIWAGRRRGRSTSR